MHSSSDTVTFFLVTDRPMRRGGIKREEKKGKEKKRKEKVHEEKQFKQVLAIPMALADDYDRLPPTRRGTTAAFDDRSRKRRARVPHTNRHYLFILTSWPIRSHVMELLARPYTPRRRPWPSHAGSNPGPFRVATDRGVSRCTRCASYYLTPPVHSTSRRSMYRETDAATLHPSKRAPRMDSGVRAYVVVHHLAAALRTEAALNGCVAVHATGIGTVHFGLSPLVSLR